jgi:hypothetical protein
MKPRHRDASFNPEEHWGDDNYYHDYLDFFTSEIQRDCGDGRRTVERWMFEEDVGKRGQFYTRCMTGAYHPFIHLGYGLEFDLNCMLAEGLAQAAIHSPMVAPLMANGDENTSGNHALPPPHNPKEVTVALGTTGPKSAKEIALAVAGDEQLDGKVRFEDAPKMKALLTNGGGPLLRAHAAQWNCPLDQVYEKAHELQQLAVAVMGGAVRPEKEVKFDFFLYVPEYLTIFSTINMIYDK